ncbi:nicotinamidase-related amidase [Novosphingobium hassiacum]|uniref:Nicotinamidase-related amidase n=1 Tax=Novosphingobium hassiacum TaxID=173676 RepID=A0A7W5ZVY0_9SPHN|nr:cysteine hydrolase [Novosphingobium hassiacum]MBB3860920.1 nicotinamidase-related amidase [Novosphingobium hassiacum]
MRLNGLDKGQRPALLISEVQNGITNARYTFSPLVEQVEVRGIVARIAALADAFRAAGAPVIFCNIVPRADFKGFPVNCVLASQLKKGGKVMAGRVEALTHDDLPIMPGDIVMERSHGMAPFTGTELDAILRGEGVQTIVLCGVSTNIALPGASTEAIALGYSVVLAEDCTAGGTAETHQMQVSMHLPLLATIAPGEIVADYVAKQSWAA